MKETLLEETLRLTDSTITANPATSVRRSIPAPQKSNGHTAPKSFAPDFATPDFAPKHSPKDVFICPEESQFYSQCLEKLVFNHCLPVESVIEFGTGDGSPVINALLKTKFAGRIHGYELNAAACEVARTRIEQYALTDKYLIHNQCFFKHAPTSAHYLIANPPYLPAPDSDLYMPSLHGGSDGAAITNKLLAVGCENVMVMISAYSNPVETVAWAIAQNYQLVDFMIAPLPFGYYSQEPKVRNTINTLRHQQKAFYSANIYFLAGALFKQKNRATIDLSTEFLKVMTAL